MATVHWEMPNRATFTRYVELIQTIHHADADQNMEARAEAWDEFRQLPGFPDNYNPDEDTVVPVVARGPRRKVVSIPANGPQMPFNIEVN